MYDYRAKIGFNQKRIIFFDEPVRRIARTGNVEGGICARAFAGKRKGRAQGLRREKGNRRAGSPALRILYAGLT
jgi:hypothetical protein